MFFNPLSRVSEMFVMVHVYILLGNLQIDILSCDMAIKES